MEENYEAQTTVENSTAEELNEGGSVDNVYNTEDTTEEVQ